MKYTCAIFRKSVTLTFFQGYISYDAKGVMDVKNIALKAYLDYAKDQIYPVYGEYSVTVYGQDMSFLGEYCFKNGKNKSDIISTKFESKEYIFCICAVLFFIALCAIISR